MPSNNHINMGNQGERLTLNYLKSNNYTILDENWRHGKLEIDLVCRNPDALLVFVEVKTRKSSFYGNPEEAVSEKKADNLLRAAELYLEEHQLNEEFRFDIVAVILNKKTTEITHFKDAVSPF